MFKIIDFSGSAIGWQLGSFTQVFIQILPIQIFESLSACISAQICVFFCIVNVCACTYVHDRVHHVCACCMCMQVGYLCGHVSVSIRGSVCMEDV